MSTQGSHMVDEWFGQRTPVQIISRSDASTEPTVWYLQRFSSSDTDLLSSCTLEPVVSTT